ncbi:signal peptidase I [Mycetocola zhadangensis]|uniref:signal peptidase I n=1 Tax=Mycetocola zhadangensis TaxID=1164595 RepID=UPI001C7CD509|nr:signal peptidase I [Mycetocola zhadangensis]
MRVVSWTVLVVCGLLIVAFVLVPRLTGSTPYTVLTGSMRPSMPPGTTVVVKPIEFSQIKVGDVITYQISSGKPEVVTHRVIGVNVTPDGVRLETQGDANPAPDADGVREEQVRGKVWYWLPVIGYVTNGVTSDTRTWLAQGLGVALIGYAVVTLIVTVVRRRKSDPAESEPEFVSGEEAGVEIGESSESGSRAGESSGGPHDPAPELLTRRSLREDNVQHSADDTST